MKTQIDRMVAPNRKIARTARTNQDKDRMAMEAEVTRLEQKLDDNRTAPKYDRRSNSYEPWYYAQGRLTRQIEAAKKAIEVFSVRRYDD